MGQRHQERGRERGKPLTAHELYSLLVGEIGQPRDLTLFGLKLWEIKAIIKGYRQRSHLQAELTRWQTYSILSAFVNLSEQGFPSPSDLLPFSWDKPKDTTGDDKEALEMLQQLKNMRKGRLG